MFRYVALGAGVLLFSCGGKIAPEHLSSEPVDEMPATVPPSTTTPPSSTPADFVPHPAPPGTTCAPDPRMRLGVVGGRLYWVLTCTDAAGAKRRVIASAPTGARSASVVYSIDAVDSEGISLFEVDAHVVFQRAGGSVFAVRAGTTNAVELAYSSSACISITTDAARGYCLAPGTDRSVLSWPVDGSAPTPTLVVRLGANASALQVDEGFLYFANAGDPDHNDPYSLERSGVFRLRLDGARKPIVIHNSTHAADLRARRGVNVWIDTARASGAVGPPYLVGAPFPEAAPWQLDLDADDPSIDPTSPTIWYVKRDTARARIMSVSPDGRDKKTFASGLDPTTRIAVDATHVYWTTPEGIERRAK